MTELRAEFHGDLDDVRNEIALLGATVVELIPRVTAILLQQDLEGAEYVLRGDDEIDARAASARRSRPPSAPCGCWRSKLRSPAIFATWLRRGSWPRRSNVPPTCAATCARRPAACTVMRSIPNCAGSSSV